mgnify:FL=1
MPRRPNQKIWTTDDVLYLLTELKTKMSFKDWNEIQKEVAKDLNTTLGSVKATFSNCRYIVTGVGLYHNTEAQIKATEMFVKKYGKSMFL